METISAAADMENPFQSPLKAPSTPGTPLQQLSPDRLNQRIPNSPSLPTTLDRNAPKHVHRTSDASEVKARVAFLNSMAQRGSPTRPMSPSKSHAAIQRAIVGREEAEAALDGLTSQLENAKARERLVAERVESLMEQLQEARNRQRHERQVYEKEIKSAKKNEYKAELAVIKLQEDIRELKNDLEGFKVRADHDKSEKEKARQEAFERAYVVAGVTEELQTLKETLKVVEQERDNAVATAASKIPMDTPVNMKNRAVQTEKSGEDVANGKRKAPTPSFEPFAAFSFIDDMDLEDENCTLETKYAALQQQIRWLKRQQKEDKELIHFMNMQCQFKACACRVAERRGVRFVHDYEYDQKIRAQNAKKRKTEDELPLPKYISWERRIQMKLTRQGLVPTDHTAREMVAPVEAMDLDEKHQPAKPSPQTSPTQSERVEESSVAPLPPMDVQADESQESEQIAEAEEAAQIPLPVSGEDTAQLEDFTQLMVDPATSTQLLTFSTSITGNKDPAGPASNLGQLQTHAQFCDDLFNLSPPKRVPPRPSTAMGILTTESPIRIVPESPHSATVGGRPSYAEIKSNATRIALNDESSKRVVRPRQRSQSRPNMRDRSRARSPAVHTADLARPASAFSMLESASPASSTAFPITPITKHSRAEAQSRQPIHVRTQTGPEHSHQQPYSALNETTTTTTIPLRADDGDDNDEPIDPTESQNSAGTMSDAPSSATYLKDSFNVPGTPITREAALAQIRARRDRARSVNLRKSAEQQQQQQQQQSSDSGDRSNTAKVVKTPGSVARRGVKLDLGQKLGLTGGERGRDVSHASAPGRF